LSIKPVLAGVRDFSLAQTDPDTGGRVRQASINQPGNVAALSQPTTHISPAALTRHHRTPSLRRWRITRT
jgi:hypothetical protein